GTIKVDIKSVNDAPVIEDEERIVTLQEDECYTFSGEDFPYSDAESHELKCVIISELPDPVTGMLWYDGAPVAELPCDGLRVSGSDLACGKLEFRPAQDYYGAASFRYSVQDEGGTENGGQDTSEVATFFFDLRSVNDAPELKIPPIIAGGEAASVDYEFRGDPVLLAPQIEVADVELGALNN